MQVAVEKTGPCHARVTVKVPSAELEGEVQKALQKVGGRARMKGFRPGKVPLQVLERSFGREVRRDTVKGFVQQAYERAVKEESLSPAAHPQLENEDLEVLVGQDLDLAFELWLRPEVELQEYTGLELRIPKLDVEEKELDDALADVRRRQSRPEPAGDEGLPADGIAVGKIELVLEGEVLDAREGMRLSPEVPPPGLDPKAYADALTGAREGSVIELATTVPDDFPREDARGKEGTFRATLSNVFRMVPPSDEEMRRMFAAEDDGAMRENARQRLVEAKSEQRDQVVETRLLEQVLALHPLELPSGLLDAQVKSRTARLAEELAAKEVPPEEAQAQVEAEAEAAYESAARSLSALYVIEAIARKEELSISDQDILAELRDIARRNGATLDEVRDYYGKNNLFPQLATELLEKKVRRFLREKANLTEE